jgi:hypothetical protein
MRFMSYSLPSAIDESVTQIACASTRPHLTQRENGPATSGDFPNVGAGEQDGDDIGTDFGPVRRRPRAPRRAGPPRADPAATLPGAMREAAVRSLVRAAVALR